MIRNRKLKMGMVGGGSGAFIGGIHRMAAQLDGQIELVCGVFSSAPEKSISFGKEIYLNDQRLYRTFDEMMVTEASLPEKERMDFVSIVTQNDLHFAPAISALNNDFPVIIDKPLCYTLEEARKLRTKVNITGLPFALTYTYAYYPMLVQAKVMVNNQEIGKVRKVMVEYPQGWLSDKLESTGQKQALWRSDPEKAGISNCFGDIGTHCGFLAEYISGLKITEVLAGLNVFVPGRNLDDDADVLFKMEQGVKGVISASQVAQGDENNLKFRIYGEKGGLEWSNTDHNTLLVKKQGRPTQIFRSGVDNSYLHEETHMNMRTPSGHPEGYIEAFANIYRYFSEDVRQYRANSSKDRDHKYPNIDDGFKGMALVDAVVASSLDGNIWKKIEV